MLKLDRFFSDILVFNLLLLSGTVFHVGFFTLSYIFAISSTFLFLLYKSKYRSKEIVLFFYTFSLSIFFFIFNYFFSKSLEFKDYGIVLMQVFLTLLILLVLRNSQIDFKYHLYRVLKFLVLLSLIGFLLSFFNLGKRVEFGASGYAANTVFHIFYYYANAQLGFLNFFRNQGIFWEPGLLAIYANIFLYLALFYFEERKAVVLAIICILTTLSTTGIFIMSIQLAYLIIGKKFNILQKVLVSVILVPIVVVAFLSFTGKKDESLEYNVSSYGLRTFDLYSGTMIAINNPIFGVGLNKEAFLSERDKFIPAEIEIIYDQIEERGSSNSLLMLFCSLGLVCGTLWLYMLFRQNVFTTNNRIFFVIVVLGFISEPLVFTPFFMFLTFTGVQKKIKIVYG